ncbi:MAG: repeat containing protein, partial [Bryobacterales bacterium]|nr:repeat containing protein [Bryobacterales bacterium]
VQYPPDPATFVVRITDPVKIQHARDILAGKSNDSPHLIGTIVQAPACYNQPLSFHVDSASIGFFDFATEVCDASIPYVEQHLAEVGGAFLPGNTWCPWGSKLVQEIAAPDCAASLATSVSAASYSEAALAQESIATAFATGMGRATGLTITDSTSVERTALLFSASSTQVNFLIPADTATGLGQVTIKNDRGGVFHGVSLIRGLAPGLFAANSNGAGVAAAVVLRIAGDGTQSYEPVAQFDAAQNSYVSRPIDLGAATDQVFLLLFGTGIRGRSTLAAVSTQVGGAVVETLYAGPQSEFAGLDQINVRLPRSLAGSGEIDVRMSVDGKQANVVRVNVK